MEENERALSTKAITYINIDIAVGGNYTFRISGSPLLETTVFEEANQVEDPHVKKNGEKKTVYERMLEISSLKSTPMYGPLAAWSDFAPFYQFVGKPKKPLTTFFVQPLSK